MKDRLALFLSTEGLRAGRFAEIMNIPPSSVSHLLSGRNKPGFDFIERLIVNFPSLNPDWIITGIGEMYRSEGARNRQIDSPDDNNEDAAQTPIVDADIVESQAEKIEEVNPLIVAAETKSDEETKVKQPAGNCVGRSANTTTVIVLYDDGTFREYKQR